MEGTEKSDINDSSTLNTTEKMEEDSSYPQTEEETKIEMESEDISNIEDQFKSRPSQDRPVIKLSVRLIETYKYINKVYYEAKAKKLRDQKETSRGGVHNDGYDDQNFDYILKGDEILNDRYILKHKMGKGSFGQVVCAYDQKEKCEVAIKIIKSRKPFLMQAQIEIEILKKIKDKDFNEDSHIVQLQDSFVHHNHQCLVFEILSYNLYELLRNTKFKGVSLSLVRKFTIQLLKSLSLLSRSDVNIIHCDLKPENILLRHPNRSSIKLIDFGSSCYLHKRMYSYIQSRFYRSPEVLLGLPYNQKIDMWSLGCVMIELHTGEPLFGGLNQVEQVGRIIDVLGMPPLEMIKQSPEKSRSQYFEKVSIDDFDKIPAFCDINCKCYDPEDDKYFLLKRPNKGMPKPRSLDEIIGVYSGGPGGRRLGESGHTVQIYELFYDFVKKLLQYNPEQRASPMDMIRHPYLFAFDDAVVTQSATEVLNLNNESDILQAKSSKETTTGTSSNNKDVSRGRRNEEIVSNKMRSHSAPSGVTYTKKINSQNSESDETQVFQEYIQSKMKSFEEQQQSNQSSAQGNPSFNLLKATGDNNSEAPSTTMTDDT